MGAKKSAEIAKQLIAAELERQLAGPVSLATVVTAIAAIKPDIDKVLAATTQMSYRDALVVQFAYGLANGVPVDLTVRHTGGRGVAGWLGQLLAEKHIRAVRDAFQNVGKNNVDLIRGNFKEFDDVLRWASQPTRTVGELEAAFRYTCANLAANARPVSMLPRLDRSALTFQAVCRLLDELYRKPSAGAYEQFSVAALLHAMVEQQGNIGYRVETKNLNASDKSSRSAGDVQLVLGGRVVEAIEVTANDWRQKLVGAAKTIKDNDLTRLTIIAAGVNDAGGALFDEVKATGLDLSVLELRSFAYSLVAALTKQGRASAIIRLYEFLDRYQPRYELVNDFVSALAASAETEAEAP